MMATSGMKLKNDCNAVVCTRPGTCVTFDLTGSISEMKRLGSSRGKRKTEVTLAIHSP